MDIDQFKSLCLFQYHQCATCERNDIKLYRPFESFLRNYEIFCIDHAPTGAIESGDYVPLMEDTDGSVWGYFKAPPDARERFAALPDR